MTDSSPLVDGMSMIHKIITRGINVAIQKCDEYTGKQGVPPAEVKGFSMYVTTLKTVIHSHHGSEDEIEGGEREAFMIPFPWIVKKVLVPVIWKGQWKPMSPFLLE